MSSASRTSSVHWKRSTMSGMHPCLLPGEILGSEVSKNRKCDHLALRDALRAPVSLMATLARAALFADRL